MHLNSNHAPVAVSRGFTLIEVLVAIIVLSIGLLGLARLQATSLQFTDSAQLRTQATNLAYDIADRMRANRARTLAGDYVSTTTTTACGSVTLAGSTIAQRDIQAWRIALACMLPSGNGSIGQSGNELTITIQWDDSRGQEALQQFVAVTRL